jgi:hypothetical protein
MKFPCVLENALLIIRVCSGLSFATKRIGPPCYTFVTVTTCFLLRIILLSKLSITTTFSTCREYLAGNRLLFPSAPRWVRHSYLSKGLRLIPYTCGSLDPSTGPPTYQIIKVMNANQLNMMSVTRREFPCVLESTLLYIRETSGLSFATKRIGPPCCTFAIIVTCYLVWITLLPKLSVTTIYSTCREYLAENRLSFPSAPRWVWHSYSSKGLWLIPYTCGSSPISREARYWAGGSTTQRGCPGAQLGAQSSSWHARHKALAHEVGAL